MVKSDQYYMKKALKQAEIALKRSEVPIGAILVDENGNIISKGHNLTESLNCQINHAEVRAIKQACNRLKSWRLDKCTIYITLHPCMMCLGLICLSRIKRVVYGANSPLFGYFLDNQSLPDLYKKHIRGITSGILSEESEALLKKFFKQKRVFSG